MNDHARCRMKDLAHLFKTNISRLFNFAHGAKIFGGETSPTRSASLVTVLGWPPSGEAPFDNANLRRFIVLDLDETSSLFNLRSSSTMGFTKDKSISRKNVSSRSVKDCERGGTQGGRGGPPVLEGAARKSVDGRCLRCVVVCLSAAPTSQPLQQQVDTAASLGLGVANSGRPVEIPLSLSAREFNAFIWGLFPALYPTTFTLACCCEIGRLVTLPNSLSTPRELYASHKLADSCLYVCPAHDVTQTGTPLVRGVSSLHIEPVNGSSDDEDSEPDTGRATHKRRRHQRKPPGGATVQTVTSVDGVGEVKRSRRRRAVFQRASRSRPSSKRRTKGEPRAGGRRGRSKVVRPVASAGRAKSRECSSSDSGAPDCRGRRHAHRPSCRPAATAVTADRAGLVADTSAVVVLPRLDVAPDSVTSLSAASTSTVLSPAASRSSSSDGVIARPTTAKTTSRHLRKRISTKDRNLSQNNRARSTSSRKKFRNVPVRGASRKRLVSSKSKLNSVRKKSFNKDHGLSQQTSGYCLGKRSSTKLSLCSSSKNNLSRNLSRNNPSRTVSRNNPSRTSSRNNPSRSSSRNNPSRTSSRNNASRSSSRNNPSRTSSRNNPSRSSSRNNPSRTSSRNNPSCSSSRNNPSRTSSRNNPSRNLSRNNPSRTSSRNNPSRNLSRNNPSRSSSRNNPSRTSSRNNPSHSSSRNNPSRTSSINNPSRTSSRNNPSRTSSRNNPSPSSSRNNPSRNLSRNNPSRSSSRNNSSRTSSRNSSVYSSIQKNLESVRNSLINVSNASRNDPSCSSHRTTGASHDKRPHTKPVRSHSTRRRNTNQKKSVQDVTKQDACTEKACCAQTRKRNASGRSALVSDVVIKRLAPPQRLPPIQTHSARFVARFPCLDVDMENGASCGSAVNATSNQLTTCNNSVSFRHPLDSSSSRSVSGETSGEAATVKNGDSDGSRLVEEATYSAKSLCVHCGRTMASEGRDNEDGCLICLQNSEYIASLEADKKKLSTQLDLQRIQADLELKNTKLQNCRNSQLAREPENGFLIKVKFPDSTTKSRKFLSSNNLLDLVNFIGSEQSATEQFSMTVAGVAERLHCRLAADGLTLADIGIVSPVLMHIQWHMTVN